MHSSAKYCPNANNSVKKWLFLKKQASLSSIPKSAFLDIKFIRHFYHVIWVEKTHTSDIPFYGSPCTFFYLFFLILFHLFTFLSYLLVVFLLYNVLQHLHKQVMELWMCVSISFHFCQLFMEPGWGKTYFLFFEIYALYVFSPFYFFISFYFISFHFILFYFILFSHFIFYIISFIYSF